MHNTHGVLETEQNKLDLVDGGAVEVQIQFELGDGGSHDPALGGADKVPQDADDLLDMIYGQLQLLCALRQKYT